MKKYLVKAKKFLVSLYCKVALFATAKYNAAYEVVTLKLLAQTSKMVKKLLLLKGKDPDYVPPPPPAPTLKVVENPLFTRVQEKVYFTGVASAPAWVKSPSDHPVLASRKVFETNQKLEADKKAARYVTTTESNLTVTDELQLSESAEELKQILEITDNTKFTQTESSL